MALDDRIEAVEKVSEALDKASAEPQIERTSANKELFDSLMSTEQDKAVAFNTQTQQGVTNVNASEQSNRTSLMDEVKKLNSKVSNISKLTPEDLKNQARDVIAQIQDVKSKLSNAEHIKPAYQTVLKNHLSHINDNLKIALSKAGVEYNPQIANAGSAANSPIQRFLGFLTQGQYQLEHLNESIEGLTKAGTQLSPITMLSLQMKVGVVQNQIELFTSCLNKALESTKTLMNVQV